MGKKFFQLVGWKQLLFPLLSVFNSVFWVVFWLSLLLVCSMFHGSFYGLGLCVLQVGVMLYFVWGWRACLPWVFRAGILAPIFPSASCILLPVSPAVIGLQDLILDDSWELSLEGEQDPLKVDALRGFVDGFQVRLFQPSKEVLGVLMEIVTL